MKGVNQEADSRVRIGGPSGPLKRNWWLLNLDGKLSRSDFWSDISRTAKEIQLPADTKDVVHQCLFAEEVELLHHTPI